MTAYYPREDDAGDGFWVVKDDGTRKALLGDRDDVPFRSMAAAWNACRRYAERENPQAQYTTLDAVRRSATAQAAWVA